MNKSSVLRILLIEDDEHDQIAFQRALDKSEMGFEVTGCSRAEEALKRLSDGHSSFDLVVVDYKLPGMSGLDLCRQVLDRRSDLPLVLLTGKGSEQLAVNALKAGVTDYLVKDPSEGYLDLLPLVLLEVVQKHRDRQAHKEAEEALRIAHHELERRIEERTAKLASTAEQLTMEIKERKRSQEQLERYAAELERSNEALEKFAYVASHDLQEPLRTLTTYLRMLHQIHGEKLGDDAEEYIINATDAANRMSRLIENLLTYSRVTDGKPATPKE
jgi:DNA-binding response OmpR family regulator